MRIVVAGASGYVGSRLVPELLRRGHEVVATCSSAPEPGRFSWGAEVTWARMPAQDEQAVDQVLHGTDAVCYLVHSLPHRDFAVVDRRAAEVVARGAARAGLRRLVYLSGLVPAGDPGRLSAHLRSRLEVELILAAGPVPATVLRAGVVIGAGSTSFEIVRQVSALSWVQPVPGWAGSRVQPVSVADVVDHLADALAGSATGSWDIGGGDVVSYAQLMQRYARAAGTLRLQLPVPGVPAAAAAALAPLVCAAPWWTVHALVQSMQHDMVCRPERTLALRGRPAVGLDEALRRSLTPPSTPDEATRPGGDPHRAAACDPPWTRLPGTPHDLRLPGVGPLAAAAHVARHRLSGAFSVLAGVADELGR